MTSQPLRPRFFVTAESACSYLPGRTERKVFAELRGGAASATNDTLGRIGFRRSQNVAYRPSCIGCAACVSVRIPVAAFVPSRSQRRTAAAHADLSSSVCQPWATQEQYDLMLRYLALRHPDGGMARMDAHDFADMIEATPVDTVIVEYRDKDDTLMGATLADVQSDGLSLVYSWYDAVSRPGLGTAMILDQVRRAGEAGLPHVYLGYWVQNSPRMAYKARFRPLERLTKDGWKTFDPS
jgi:arginine-tRNA-protein transferase